MGRGRRLGYRPALDGVRAVAIAAVVSMHSFGWPAHGALGVDLFFVLSGFLITTILLDEQAESGSISLVRFYKRRAWRLFPALFAMLATYTTAVILLFAIRGELSSLGSRLVAIGVALGYGANLFAMAGWTVPLAIGHLWSLAQEEQFYLLWPIAILLLRRRPVLLTWFVAAFVAFTVVERFVLMGPNSFYRVYLGPDTHSEPILVGCLFGLWFARRRPLHTYRPKWPIALCALAFIVGMITLLAPICRAFSESAAGLLYGTPLLTLFSYACGLLIIDCAIGASVVARVLSGAPFRFLGQISYSLYLWHLPVLVAFGVGAKPGLKAIVALASSLLLACLSRFCIELPLLRRSRLKRPPAAQTARTAPAAAPAGA